MAVQRPVRDMRIRDLSKEHLRIHLLQELPFLFGQTFIADLQQLEARQE
jgi:hypothetical protein